MLTGTPLDLTPLGPLLHAAAWVYWGLALLLVVLLLRSKLKWFVKLPLALAVPALFVWPVWRGVEESKAVAEAADARLAAAMARFKDRCRGAGETIHRAVENVDGIVWMKWRPKRMNLDRQFDLSDPFGQDCWGEGCILDLLRVTRTSEAGREVASKHTGKYTFVESIDPTDNGWYRFEAETYLPWTSDEIDRFRTRVGKDPDGNAYRLRLRRAPIGASKARYGVTWDDISTREDRESWIAGGSLKVIDLQTQEVIAERIGYVIDRGQGNTVGSRSPWAFAKDSACPALTDPAGNRSNVGFTQRFVYKVLKPAQGKQ